jgi:hypothetical protein
VAPSPYPRALTPIVIPAKAGIQLPKGRRVTCPSIVIPAKAGIQLPKGRRVTCPSIVIPAKAGIQLAAS